MGRALGIVWIVFALVGGIALGASQIIGLEEDGLSFLLGSSFPVLTNIVYTLATALTYWLIIKASRSAAPIVLGWIHLLLAGAGTGAFIAGNLARNAALNGEVDFAVVGAIYGVGSLSQLVGGLLFLIALTVAISTGRKRPAQEDF
ncbi:MAG: hypothetical protein AAF829_05220 [Pseudomonadota bacterium]